MIGCGTPHLSRFAVLSRVAFFQILAAVCFITEVSAHHGVVYEGENGKRGETCKSNEGCGVPPDFFCCSPILPVLFICCLSVVPPWFFWSSSRLALLCIQEALRGTQSELWVDTYVPSLQCFCPFLRHFCNHCTPGSHNEHHDCLCCASSWNTGWTGEGLERHNRGGLQLGKVGAQSCS